MSASHALPYIIFLRDRINISYMLTNHMKVEARLYPIPPIMVNHAKFGLHLVSHQDRISMIKNPNGKAITTIFRSLGTPTEKLKIKPIKKNMKLMPNKWI